MSGFFASLFDEIVARRRRLRQTMGDRGQAISEFLVLGGLAIGSLGLFLRPWMAAAAPWGFAIPFAFLVGYALIEARRQKAMALLADGEADARLARAYDWGFVLWSLFCAVAGAAAFVVAWSAEPAPPPEPEAWAPPDGAIAVEISP